MIIVTTPAALNVISYIGILTTEMKRCLLKKEQMKFR